MIADVGNLAFGPRSHTGAKYASERNLPLCSRPASKPHALVFFPLHQAKDQQQPNFDSEPYGSDANPGIAGALTFARSTPTSPESVGGPRFFRTHHACVDDSNCHRPGMNLPTDRDVGDISAHDQKESSVQESVVRTRPRVLPPVGTGGTLRTWLTSDDVRVALSATFSQGEGVTPGTLDACAPRTMN